MIPGLAEQWSELIAVTVGAILGWFTKWFSGRGR